MIAYRSTTMLCRDSMLPWYTYIVCDSWRETQRSGVYWKWCALCGEEGVNWLVLGKLDRPRFSCSISNYRSGSLSNPCTYLLPGVLCYVAVGREELPDLYSYNVSARMLHHR